MFQSEFVLLLSVFCFVNIRPENTIFIPATFFKLFCRPPYDVLPKIKSVLLIW